MRNFEVNENPAWIRQEEEPEQFDTRRMLIALGIMFLAGVAINWLVLEKQERL